MRAAGTKTKTWQYGDTEPAWGLGQRNKRATQSHTLLRKAGMPTAMHDSARFIATERYNLMKPGFSLGLKTKDKFNTSHLSARICVLG